MSEQLICFEFAHDSNARANDKTSNDVNVRTSNFGTVIKDFESNRIIDFICTDAWAPICIFLHVSGQNESVHIKSIDTLIF